MTWPRVRPVVWLMAALAVMTLAIAPALFEGNPPASPSAGADAEGYSAGPNGDVRAVQVVRKDRDQSVDQVLKHRVPVAVRRTGHARRRWAHVWSSGAGPEPAARRHDLLVAVRGTCTPTAADTALPDLERSAPAGMAAGVAAVRRRGASAASPDAVAPAPSPRRHRR